MPPMSSGYRGRRVGVLHEEDTMNLRHSLTLMVFAFGVTIFPSAALLADSAPDGKTLFHTHCSVCHGQEGTGEDPQWLNGGWREDGTRIAPALNGTAHAWHHEPQLLYSYVKDGSIDTTSPMPSFGDQLTDEQIWSVIRYIQSLWPEKIRKIYEERFPGGLGEQD